MAYTFLMLAAFLLVGLGVQILCLKIPLPRVTLLILAGIIMGPSALDLFPEQREVWFPVISEVALTMLGFLIGGSMTTQLFREQGKEILILSLGVAVGTFTAVFLGMVALGEGLALALLFAAIATATDPAATSDVVMEAGCEHSRFGRRLLGIVAVDDAWGLVIFSLCMALVAAAASGSAEASLVTGLREIGGAVLLGLGIGLPMALLTGRIRKGEPILMEALGLVFLCVGLAMILQVSYLLAAVVMGATVTNLAKHHKRPFRAIEGIEWPFLLLFFILAGASLEVSALLAGGLVGVAYLCLRIVGKVAGGYLTGAIWGSAREGARTGLSMLPQAGVAVAMALTASTALPRYSELLLAVVLASTVVFELLGPLAARWALRGEAASITASE